jgi:hypothetical protein
MEIIGAPVCATEVRCAGGRTTGTKRKGAGMLLLSVALPFFMLGLPPFAAGAASQGPVVIDRVGPVLVNQAGYNLGEAKRFTVPGARDGTPFRIRRLTAPAPGELRGTPGEVVYEGTVKDYSGYFTDFDPRSVHDEYVVEVDGHGDSHPFWIGDHLMERLSARLAYQFFIDVRGGTDVQRFDPRQVAGGGPSRDGGAYTLETVFQTLLYSSNPALFDRWTDELAPSSVPDLIALTLWHADFAHRFVDFNGPTGHRPYHLGYEGESLQSYDYQNTLDQLAAVVGSYHAFLHRYMDEATYREYRQLCLERWKEYDRHRVVRHWVKSEKWIDEGWQEFNEMGNAYGQSVFRNLFMYLAERDEPDGRPDEFLRYAQDAAADMVQNWDFANPRHTWLARNAEHITPQALAFFLLVAPEDAPEGTLQKLADWRDYILRRTDNLWHYRTHSDTEWAHPRSKEVGTVAGLGGSMFAAAHRLDDPRLREIGWSQVNFVFGLNPVAAHLSHMNPERLSTGGYWLGVERGWPDGYGFGAGRLRSVRGALDGSPLDPAFPYAPERFRGSADSPYWATEGWAATNRAWMSTVAFSTLGSHAVRVTNPVSGDLLRAAATGDSVRVELRAALNQDYGDPSDHSFRAFGGIERGWVEVRVNGDAPRRITVTETGPNTGLFAATVRLGGDGEPDERRLQVRSGDRVEFSYGYLGFQKLAFLDVR